MGNERGERTNRWPNFRVKDSYSHAIYHLQFEPASLGRGTKVRTVGKSFELLHSAILWKETGLIRDLPNRQKVAELMIV